MTAHYRSAEFSEELAALQARVAELEAQLAQRTADDQQRQYYAQIVESVHDAVIAVDARFRITLWNAAATAQYGWQPAEVYGRVVAEVVPQIEYLDGGSSEDALQVLMRDGMWSGEIVQQARDGRHIIVDSRVRLIRGDDGTVQGVVAVNRNVTARKQAELSVRDSEASLRAIFESSQQMIVLLDPGCQVKAFNSYAQREMRCLGLDLQLGHSILEYLDPAYHALFAAHFRQALGGSSQRVDREVVGPSGSEWWEFSYNPILLDDGQVTGVSWIVRNITERVRAEQQARKSAARLRLLIEQLPAIIWTLDRNGQLSSLVGAGLSDAAGVQRQTEPGFAQLHQTYAPFMPPAVHQQALDGQSASYEIDWRGSIFQCYAEPFLDDAGAISGSIGIGVDVSERVRARQLQEEQRRFFEALATGAPLTQVLDMLALAIESQVAGGVCSVLLVDERGQSLRPGAAPSLPPDYLVAVGSVPIGPVSGSCGTAAHRGAPVIVSDIASDPLWAEFKELALSFDMRSCWSVPFCDSQGAVLGTFAVYRHEPSAPTPTELSYLTNAAHLAAVAVERTRTETALREREELYRLITENSGELISLIDQGGTLLYASPSYAQTLGYDPATICGRSLFDLVHLDDLPLLLDDWERLTGGRRILCTVRFRHADGSWRWIDAHGATIRRDQRVQVVCVGRDVTERMQAELERRRLEAQLAQAQKMESIGTLTGGIAHDFNNVLSVILGNAQLGLLQSAPDALEQPLLAEIEQAATRGSALTKQLLAFSRRQQLERQPIDLNRTISDLSLMLSRLIGKDVEIVMSLAADLASIAADPVQIEQILLNLVVNARDAMPGGGRLEIATAMVELTAAQSPYEWAQPGRYVQVVVRDTGLGMDATTQQRVFEPFFTTKAQGKGTGLGLAVVYGIVKQHDGFIHVDSWPGGGTAFTILFPAEAAGPQRSLLPPLPDVPGGSETILVVEDEAPLRRLARAILQRLGYTVLLAEDGQRGVELFQANAARIDLVVLDLIMPRLGGREALAQMRMQQPGLRALLVSGFDKSSDPLGSDGLSIAPLLAKPYRLDVLGRAVRDILDGPAADAL